jgi:hypothetical protein
MNTKPTRRPVRPGISHATDPIFAAITEYQRADRASYVSYSNYAHGPATWRAEYPEFNKARQGARRSLAKTVPTTLDGAVALLALFYKQSPWECGDMNWHPPVMRNAIAALKRMVAETEARS